MKSPILFLVFNRVNETVESFETIKKAKPPKLYVAADGPKNSSEKEVCDAVRKIATNVTWDCEVSTLFREDNLGCKTAIVSAMDWFFKNEPEGIIIEDDVIPNQEFFPFCDTLLDRYRNNQEIKAINGFNQFGQDVTNDSYFFSRGFYPWGWATWRSRWANYKANNIDVSRLDDPDVKKVYHRAALEGVKFNLNIINKGVLDTWDYQMLYMIMSEKGYIVTPRANLTSNIGVNGAHSTNNRNIFFKYGKMSINDLIHPEQIADDRAMNAKLWEEYKQAYFGVKVKNVLFRSGLYQPLRKLYRKGVRFFSK